MKSITIGMMKAADVLETSTPIGWTVALGVDAVIEAVDIGTISAGNVANSFTVRWAEANVFGTTGRIAQAVLLTPGSHTRN